MKDDDLENQLRAARVPERDEDYWLRFPQTVLGRIGAARTQRHRSSRRRQGLLLAAAAGACGLAAGLLLSHRPPRPDAYARLESGQALRETVPLYLGRLRAIEQEGDSLRLVLSKDRDVPPSLPVWVEIDDGHSRRVLDTFSGQSFRLGDQTVQVLANPEGEVMLVGERFLWTNRGPAAPEPAIHAKARVLARDF